MSPLLVKMPLYVNGNWNIFKGRLKQSLARFTKNNAQFLEGKTDELIGRIQKRADLRRSRVERAAELAHENGSGHH